MTRLLSTRLYLITLVLLISAIAVHFTPHQQQAMAITAEEKLDDPAMEARARNIGRELRCLVCQNQSIDDSDAELAVDLRKLVRERLLLRFRKRAPPLPGFLPDVRHLVAGWQSLHDLLSVLIEPHSVASTWERLKGIGVRVYIP